MGEEFKNENSEEAEDSGEDGEEEIDDIGDVFFGVKQENLHVLGVIPKVTAFGIDVVGGGKESEAKY